MTVIGNTSTFAFELVPVTPSWEVHYPPERAAWAGTAIWVAGQNLCRHVVPGSNAVNDYFYVPLGPIADWLVRAFPAIQFQERASFFPTTRDLHGSVERWGEARPPHGFDEDSWLDAREDWWSGHFLRAGADGAYPPNMAFVRDDEELAISWEAPHFFGDGRMTMLCARGRSSLPWGEGLSVLDQVTSTVAAWFRQSDAAHAYAWAAHDHPLQSAEPSLNRAIELFTGRGLNVLQGQLGVSGYDALLTALKLVRSARDPAASPHCQILRDLEPRLTNDVGGLVREIGDRATHERPHALSQWREARNIALDAARSAQSPEEAGQLAATEIRHALTLDGQPVDDVQVTLAQLGLEYEHAMVPSQRDRMMVALRDDGSPVARTLDTPRTARLWGQRFEACRALGHVLLDPIREGAIGAASGRFAEESRRRRSGASAAEFLLPESALAQASGNQLDGAADEAIFARLLERYGIGASAAAHQLSNRGWLSSYDVRDDLTERYGAANSG